MSVKRGVPLNGVELMPWPDWGEWVEPYQSYGDEIDMTGYVKLKGDGPRRVTRYEVAGLLKSPDLGGVWVIVRGYVEVPASLSWYEAGIALDEAVEAALPGYDVDETGMPLREEDGPRHANCED